MNAGHSCSASFWHSAWNTRSAAQAQAYKRAVAFRLCWGNQHICDAGGVKKIRVHDMRHSHAGMLEEPGFSPLLRREQTMIETYSYLYLNKQAEVAIQRNGVVTQM